MNYGHSFGHAIESATAYAIPHGIAVTIGMDVANYLSCRFGFIDQAVFDELHLFLAANYAGFERTPIPESRFFSALSKDKKNAGDDLSLILLKGPGQVFKGRFPRDEPFQAVCREYLQRRTESQRKELCPSL